MIAVAASRLTMVWGDGNLRVATRSYALPSLRDEDGATTTRFAAKAVEQQRLRDGDGGTTVRLRDEERGTTVPLSDGGCLERPRSGQRA